MLNIVVYDHMALSYSLDNIISAVFGYSDSGVIVNNVSHHQMIYTYSTIKGKAIFISHKSL